MTETTRKHDFAWNGEDCVCKFCRQSIASIDEKSPCPPWGTDLNAREQYAERRIRKGLQLPVVKRRHTSMHPRSYICHFSTLNLDINDPQFGYVMFDADNVERIMGKPLP